MSRIEIISASAGSGKTFRLTQLLEAGVVDMSVRPQAVLATTFTNKSAAELQERVRIRLLEAGQTAEAEQLTAARIGTVNSVCGRLVEDYAFELGLSPELRVLDEEPAMLALNSQFSTVLTPELERELAELTERMQEFDWQGSVRQTVALARSNGVSSANLKTSAQRSWMEIQKLFGTPTETGDVLDAKLIKALRAFVSGVAKGTDTTKTTGNAVERAHKALRQLERGHPLPWSDWLGLTKLATAKASDSLAEPVRQAAATQDRHPRLHSDIQRAIELVFELATRALDLYQQHKRELGVIDFVDQETYALQLLARPDVREQLAGELDLVLIDEFQDTSPIQLAIFLRLAEAAQRSIWVGDQKQAIYGFRGADPALMDAAIEQILAGKEPETLPKSYRSRPGLVHFSSKLFATAFARQGIPASRVTLVPDKEKEAAGLGSFVECWRLQAKNQDEDAAALAAAAKAFLEDKSVRVRDRKDGEPRPARPGDLAILCRTNEMCSDVAEQLAALGIRPVLPRQGLLATLEGRAALAALRLWVDDRDSLAAAELARMIDFAGREDDWLATILKKPGEQAFAELPYIVRLRQQRDPEPNLGVIGVFDAVAESIGLPELCLRWGDADARLANVEALRSHVVNYITGCTATGTGCTVAGLVADLVSLAENSEDSQGVDEDDHAIVVTTWHKAKGLEWPIVVLFPLNRRDPATQALGLSVQTDQPKLKLTDPLAGRWIRFWPNPYLRANNKAPFHDRLADHPATNAAQLRAEREDLRLLYVGWTRARDRIVLAGRNGKITGDLLQLLCDEKGPLVSEPDGSTLDWAGQTVSVVIRDAGPLPPQGRMPQPGTGYVASGARDYPPAYVRPSDVAGTEVKLTAFEKIGDRVGIKGECDWSTLGNAVHGFLCADRPGLNSQQRDVLLNRLLQRWGVSSVVDAGEILRSSNALREWIAGKWPAAEWYREWPVLWRDEQGSVIRGNSDLVLKVNGGLVVIDHKSFPGSIDQALVRSADYRGQLSRYASAIEVAMGQKVLSQWIHLPISGIVVPLLT